MKKLLGVLLGLLVVVVLVGVGLVALSNHSLGPVSDAAQNAKAAVANVAMDAADVKGKINDAVKSNRSAIQAATGLTDEQFDEAVAGLAINDWQAVALPNDAVATGTESASALGVDGTITTYEDPSYVTVNAYGQDVTLAVPESAQAYLPYLALLG
ncbi:hypothetical protein [Gordonibacter massiliensis (ex Traore et al. 2017)]|nr:hypothetical protein [Gordonibacter massiliensis (ex Traore et al. 2017)]MBX9033917.1 hypothetical protein [Gordonibacter massiliensis (ex Traore et al. 2017)]